jgi:hypothetical protein
MRIARRTWSAVGSAFLAVMLLTVGVGLTVWFSLSASGWKLFEESSARRLDALRAEPGSVCDGQRWAIKTLSDSEASQVSFSPVPTTVHDLLRLSPPQWLGHKGFQHRAVPVELTTYVLTAVAIELKPDTDNDTHLIIADPSDLRQTMVTEFVYWGCTGAVGSRQRQQFRTAFEQLHSVFKDTISPTIMRDGQIMVLADWYAPRWTTPYRTPERSPAPWVDSPPDDLIRSALVEISGVGFFDPREHRAKGAAPNGIQLHPVLSIRRLP